MIKSLFLLFVLVLCGCGQIGKLQNKIFQGEFIHCEKCGKQVGAVEFCPKCGSEISKIYLTLHNSLRNCSYKDCSQCGTLNDMYANFCSKCRTNIKNGGFTITSPLKIQKKYNEIMRR